MKKEMIKLMCERFLDSEELTTKELIELGFTNKELSKFVENGMLTRVRRGYYKLNSTDALTELYREYSKKKDFKKVVQIIKRCLDIDSNNIGFNLLLLSHSIGNNDFEQIFKCFDTLFAQNTYSYYERDYNLWLFMLNFVTELPERYKSKIKNITFEHIFASSNDCRYKDCTTENNIRRSILWHNFPKAIDLINGTNKEKNIYELITARFCYVANKVEKRKKFKIQTLVAEEKYDELIRTLNEYNERYGLNILEKTVYSLVQDLLWISENNKILDIGSCETDDFNEAIEKRDYKKALQLSRKFTDNFRSSTLPVLLERITSKIENIKKSVEDENVTEKDQESSENISNSVELSNEEVTSFSQIVSSLMMQDIDGAFNLLNKYLEELGKVEYRGFIGDLIKLSLLNNDMAFVEPMAVLAKIAIGECCFDVSIYLQDFYINLVNRDYKKAAIYLDIISMSSMVGLVELDTTDMKKTLIEEAERFGISAQELGMVDENIEVPVIETTSGENINNNEGKNNLDMEQNIDEKVMETESDVEEVVTEVEEQPLVEEDTEMVICSLADIMGDVLEDTNLIMLEPMSDDEISEVLSVTSGVRNIQTKVIVDPNGDKHVVLRYIDKNGEYIDISSTLRKANRKFNNWEYNDAIDLYQSVLPKLDSPKSFIYGNLGYSYYRTTYNGDYAKAIDYLSMAIYESSYEDKFLDYTKLLSELKQKSGYNGVNITTGSGDEQKSMAPQLKK